MSGKDGKVARGGCLCGHIRFEAQGLPAKPHTCSCKMCQRHTGALTVAWVEYARDAVAWTGTGGAPAVYRSSDVSSRAFCPRCGSTIGAIDDKPTIGLVLGVFDPPLPRNGRPATHAFKAARPKWWRVEIGP